jgi:uncharacterized phage-associated protein
VENARESTYINNTLDNLGTVSGRNQDRGIGRTLPAPYRASTVANAFFRLAEAEGRSLTPMQYVKLVYIAHGWCLALSGQPLIDETVEAWKFGPVVPSLYRDLKNYGAGGVTAPISRWPMRQDPEIDHDHMELIQSVYENYGRLTGVQLSNLTHQKGTPWANSWDPNGWGIDISDDDIRRHYEMLKERAH